MQCYYCIALILRHLLFLNYGALLLPKEQPTQDMLCYFFIPCRPSPFKNECWDMSSIWDTKKKGGWLLRWF